MAAKRYWFWLAGILVSGLLLRLAIAYLPLSPGINSFGFSWDISTFADWMFTIRSSGFHAYEVDPSLNYPPVFADILQGLNIVGDLFGGGNPSRAQQISIILLKLPAILADVAIAATLAAAGKKWYSPKVGLWAAVLVLFIPVFWYDSAIWGQVDSVSALFMLLAVVLIADRKPEWSMIFLVAAILTKPQGVLAGLIIVPILIGQAIRHEYSWKRLVSTFASAFLAFAVLALPWHLNSYAHSPLGNVPLIGDIAGLEQQYASTAGLFQVVTANAFNPWALFGTISLAEQVHTGSVAWGLDSQPILGIPANWFGLAAFGLIAALVCWLLVRKPSVQNAFFGFAVVLVAFFDLPTRVHERYLVQAFAILCLIWATKWRDRLILIALAVANTVNLHAILSNGLNVQFPVSTASNDIVVYPHHGQSPDYYGIVGVPFDSGITREPWLVYFVVGLHVFALAYLLAQFIVMNFRKAQSR